MIIRETEESSNSGTADEDVLMSDTLVFDFSSYVITADTPTGSPDPQTAPGEVPVNKKHGSLKTQATNLSNGTSVFWNTNEIFGNLNSKENESSLYDELFPKLTQTSSPSEKITIKVTNKVVSDSLIEIKKSLQLIEQMQPKSEISIDPEPNTI